MACAVEILPNEIDVNIGCHPGRNINYMLIISTLNK